VGEDVGNIHAEVLQNVNYDVEKAQNGYSYIDEIDRSAQVGYPSNYRDVSGEGVQAGPGSLIEGRLLGYRPGWPGKIRSKEFSAG